MIRTNWETTNIISQYVEPDPVLFCRLASVNRNFYTVFTSDKVWAPLDVYGVKKDIYKHYLETNALFHGLAELFWQDTYALDNEYGLKVSPSTLNKYMILGQYINDPHLTRKNSDNSILSRAIDIRPSLLWGPRLDTITEYVYVQAISHGVGLIMHLPPSLSDKPSVCRKLLEVYNPMNPNQTNVHPFSVVCSSVITRRMIEHAMKTDPGSIFSAELKYRQLSEPTELIKQMIPDRDSLLVAIKGHCMALKMFPEYWDDKEIYLSALFYPQRGGSPKTLPDLDKWDDVDIAIAAVRVDCLYFIDIQEHFRSNHLVVRAMLESHERFVGNCLDKIDRCLLHDPEIMGLLIDKHMFSNIHSHGDFVYPKSILDVLFDNEEWTTTRIRAHARAWNMASPRLKGERKLLLLAFKSAYVSGFEMSAFPSKFYKDQEVIAAAADMGILHLVPDGILPTQVVIQDAIYFGLDRYPQHCNNPNIVCEVLKADPEQIYHVDTEVFGRVKFKQFILDHMYEMIVMWKHHSTRDMAHKKLGPKPDWNDIEPDEALALVTKFPGHLKYIPDFICDLEFILEAVAANSQVFLYLGKTLQNNDQVQKSIRCTGISSCRDSEQRRQVASRNTPRERYYRGTGRDYPRLNSRR